MKKIFLPIFVFFLLAVSGLFASDFNENRIAPTLGTGLFLNIHESVKKGTFYPKQVCVGPSLGVDSIFTMKKNGFSLMANGSVIPIFIIKENQDPYSTAMLNRSSFGVVGYFELLFGYTYSPNENFNLTVATGPASFMLVYLGLDVKLNVEYYFSKKSGIYISAGNIFGFTHGKIWDWNLDWNLMNSTTFSIGPVFRL